MKYLIASDIHGSAYYCRKMLERFGEEKADRIILLGDILYHGARNDLPKEYAPKEIIAMLNPLKDRIICVRGNCESEVDQMVLEFAIVESAFLCCPTCMEEGAENSKSGEAGSYPGGKDRLIFITHGHKFNLMSMPNISKDDILLHGHTHIPALEITDKCTYINPGSTSIPKENSKHSYMTLEDGVFQWKDVESGEVYKEYSV